MTRPLAKSAENGNEMYQCEKQTVYKLLLNDLRGKKSYTIHTLGIQYYHHS